ncbi:hypothetical protein [Pandoraea sp. SD6-2]|uniref:hypothetical protein n=1 Tax=Pandoraea sp. SD6-2 TaxID=1286093 RepID=UPI000568FBD0|nr:hypothetical protein [Pandoraea sp. SD6-2]
MMLKFRNPADGDVVEITYMSCVGAFFLGPVYLLAYGFAWHALLWTALAIGPALIWRDSALAISLPATCLLYSLMIQPLLIGKLRADGWLPTRADAAPGPGQRGYDAHGDIPSTGRARQGVVLAPAQPSAATPPAHNMVSLANGPTANEGAAPSVDEKACPFCAGTIKVQAMRCHHCQANLQVPSQ